ncbi:MAG TPA: hypothetical protein VGB18_03125, partial [Candidatus Thermoplasmatota archaeon]
MTAIRRGRLRWAGVLAVILFLLPQGEASDLQQAGDAARTGLVEGDGPAWPDVAVSVRLTGSGAFGASPIIHEGNAYVLTREATHLDPGLIVDGVFRINLTTGIPEILMELPAPDPRTSGQALASSTWASDGERFFIADTRGVDAYFVADGRPAWPAPWRPEPSLPGASTNLLCAEPAVHSGLVIFACGRSDGP